MYTDTDYDCLVRDCNALERECNALEKALDEAIDAVQNIFAFIPEDMAADILAEYPEIEGLL